MTDMTSNTPEPDEQDRDPDAPGLDLWLRRRFGASVQPEPPSALVRDIANPSSAWGQRAIACGVPAEQVREALAGLESAMIRDLDTAALADLTPDSPAVTTWLEGAAREHA